MVISLLPSYTFTLAAASFICSIVKTPKMSSSLTALTTASATSSTLTGGASKRSDAGSEFKGLVKFCVASSNFSNGSPIKSRGISNPSTFLLPYMNPGLKTTPAHVEVNLSIHVRNLGTVGSNTHWSGAHKWWRYRETVLHYFRGPKDTDSDKIYMKRGTAYMINEQLVL